MTGRSSCISFEPEYPLPLDPDFMAGRIDASTLVDCGHPGDASRYLAGMTPGGIVLTPGSTQMKHPAKASPSARP